MAAVVTKRMTFFSAFVLTVCVALLSGNAKSAVLPEDRADVMYHSYDGGGVEVDGPSILVRKSIGESFSLSANHYVDSISSASIDVMATASPYTEKRTENTLAADYLHEKTIMSASVTRSTENDFDAKFYSFGISQDFFGDLTTLSIGYSKGEDIVGNSEDASFEEEADRQLYRLSISQVITRNMIANIAWETISDEGFLNNPYRSVRYRENGSYSYESELYPGTRTSNATAIKARYFLPYRAAVHVEFRRFSDSWDVTAQNYELGYTHPYKDRWIFDVKYRHYKQSEAEFYSDLFERSEETTFRARDKELSSYASDTIGVSASYEFDLAKVSFVDRGTVNLQIDRMSFDYDNFRDVVKGEQGGYAAGEEPLYKFSATVTRLFVSFWF